MDSLLILVLILLLLNVAVFFLVLCIPPMRIKSGYLFGLWAADLRILFLSFFPSQYQTKASCKISLAILFFISKG